MYMKVNNDFSASSAGANSFDNRNKDKTLNRTVPSITMHEDRLSRNKLEQENVHKEFTQTE